MKKFTIVFIGLLLMVNFGFAEQKAKENEAPASKIQSVLSGKVTDKTSGEELVGVAVKIENTETVCYTDFEGNFNFKGISPGKYKLKFELISYEEIETLNLL